MRRKPLHSGVAARPDVFMEHAVERHRGAVIQLALARTRSAADAQDIAQEVFIKLLRSTARFHDDDHLRAWLLRATHDSCVDLHRQAWRRRVETREDMGAVADRATMDPAIEEVMDHPVWTPWGAFPTSCDAPCTCTTSRATASPRSRASWDARRRQPARACIADARSWPPRSRGLKRQGLHPPLRAEQPRTRTTRPTPQRSRRHARKEPPS